VKEPAGERWSMGWRIFLKQIFSLNPREDPELQRLRAKHGINMDAKDDKTTHEIKNVPGDEDYDPWEEIRNMRSNFFFGSWITRKWKFRPIGEEKVKKELEELAKKREEEERKEKGEG
jgi:hypothetical protein